MTDFAEEEGLLVDYWVKIYIEAFSNNGFTIE